MSLCQNYQLGCRRMNHHHDSRSAHGIGMWRGRVGSFRGSSRSPTRAGAGPRS